MTDKTPNQIWIQPQYSNQVIQGGGIYHLNAPTHPSLEATRYVREDLATSTSAERTLIDEALLFVQFINEQAQADIAMQELRDSLSPLVEAAEAVMRATAKESNNAG